MPRERVELSVVIPVYNSAGIFPELYRRLTSVLKKTVKSYEIIAVLDGCTDDSFGVIQRFHDGDDRVKVVEFSRNFGHQVAITLCLVQNLYEINVYFAALVGEVQEPMIPLHKVMLHNLF